MTYGTKTSPKASDRVLVLTTMNGDHGGDLADHLEFRLLGVTDVLAGGVSVVPTSPRQRDLLVLLLLHANAAVPTDRLVDRLWRGDPPATAVSALQVYVSKLRAVIGESETARIVTVPGGYRLEVAESAVDAFRFERLAATGRDALRAGSYRTAAQTLGEALGLWRGPALDDVRHLEGVRIQVTRLDELRAEALGDLVDAELALGRHAEVLPRLEALVEEEPLRERHWAQLMVALYRDGRQADALRAYRRATEVLGEELGIEPGPDLYNLEERILLHDPSLQFRPVDEVRTNLELPPTSFVGREREIRRVLELLDERPLITFTGPGGVGKTRLAVEVGSRALEAFPDGVWFADLVPLRDPAAVVDVVAASVGMESGGEEPTVERLRRRCRHRALLLIVDNCEHVLDAVAELVGSLLEPGSPLRILATSRERLGLVGETTWTIPPLSFPDVDDAVVEPGRCEAVDLFAARARLVDPSFELDGDVAGSVVRICRRLDGLPLAIELAAAWVDVLSVAEIERRLFETLAVLDRRVRFRPLRHATLGETMRWSFELLEVDERRLLEQLSVFSGRFLLEDVEEVCLVGAVDRSAILALVTRLVEKSLLVVHHGAGDTRYSLLETVRSFAATRARTSGTAEEAERRHARRFLELAERARPELEGPNQRAWLDRLELDLENFRVAFDRLAAAGRSEEALRLAASLLWLWKMHDHVAEGAERLIGVLRRDGEVRDPIRADALMAAAMLTSATDVDAARAMLREARQLAAGAGDPSVEATALGWMGLLDRIGGDLDASQRHLEVGMAVAEEAGDERPLSLILGHLAVLARERGEFDEAVARHRRAREIDRALGNRQGEAWNTAGIGTVLLYRGEDGAAVEELRRAEAVHTELAFGFELVTVWILLAVASARLGDPDEAAIHLAQAHQRAVELESPRLLDAVYRARALVAAARGEDERAAQMLGVAARVSEDHGLARAMFEVLFAAEERRIRERLGDRFEASWAVGRAAGLPVTTAP